MPALTRRLSASLALLAAALLFAAACTGPDDPPPDSGAHSDAITLDWGAVVEVTLDNGWVIGGCGGDAPMRCVRDGGQTIGVIELLDFPADPDLLEAIERDEVQVWLDARIEGNHALFAEDRAMGCGADYEYRAMETRHLEIAGSPAAAYGFSGLQGGREIERHRDYMIVHEGSLWIVKTSASDPDGCLASELLEFTPARLAEFEAYLERLARGSVLPG